jgi:two-component system nitrogen regulation sensor histidine kinase GlnL
MLDYDPSIPSLLADSDQLIQALLNIARNGVRAAAEGGGHLKFRTRVLRQFTIGDQRYRLVARVEIIDDGPGIDPKLRDSLFYPMISGSSGGIGLGLSIAQTMINQYQGLIECRSSPGETVFTVLLPVGNGNG